MSHITCVDLLKIYDRISTSGIPVIRGLSIEISNNQMVAFQGSSGSGKTTLFNMIAGLTMPNAGKIFIDGTDLWSLNRFQRYRFRRENISIIHQHSYENLYYNKTVLENLELPLIFHKIGKKKRISRINNMLSIADLEEKRDIQVRYLSGGEMQKIAICSAIITNPKILLCDEPTGDLDTSQTIELIGFIKNKLFKKLISTVLISTHDPNVSNICDKIFFIQDGRISASKETNKRKKVILNVKKRSVDNVVDEWAILLNSQGTLTIPLKYLKKISLPREYTIKEINNDRIVLVSNESQNQK